MRTRGGPPPLPSNPGAAVPAPTGAAINLSWQHGQYDWDGAAYHWVPGEWVPSAGHSRRWQDGMWKRAGATWVWDPAHWL